MSKADRAFQAALTRWRATCANLPATAMRKALAAWDDVNQIGYHGDVEHPEEAALTFWVAELIQTRDECPGEDQDWQHPLLLAGLAVRAAMLLQTRKAPRPRRRRNNHR